MVGGCLYLVFAGLALGVPGLLVLALVHKQVSPRLKQVFFCACFSLLIGGALGYGTAYTYFYAIAGAS